MALSKMEDFRTVIEIINKLQKVNRVLGGAVDIIRLPQIVVVGSQSSGKSSVLEGLVGESFLPRGIGTVTKCPIILQLINDSDCAPNEPRHSSKDRHHNNSNEKSGTRFKFEGESDARVYTDAEHVCQKILELTQQRLAACPDKLISEVPIVLHVYSPDLVTLTVKDLPGVVRMGPDGSNQFETETKALIRKHITEKNSLILAVSAANNEISDSVGIQMAKEVDPQGERTLGVLTKLDLMDAGTDACDILMGLSDIKVRLGMIGVVNRSQQDIIDGKSVQEAMADEVSLLERKYPSIASQHGTKVLRNRLNHLLIKHIRSCMGEIQAQVRKRQNESNKVLLELGEDDTGNKLDYIFDKIHAFCENFHTEIEGAQLNVEYKRFYGSTALQNLFVNKFKTRLVEINPTKDITPASIYMAIRNSGGFDAMYGLVENAYKVFARVQILQLLGPVLELANLVSTEMLRIVDNCLSNESVFRYASFNTAVKDIMQTLIYERLEAANNYLVHYINTLASMVHTSNADFLKKTHKLLRPAVFTMNEISKMVLEFENRDYEDSSSSGIDTDDVVGVRAAVGSPAGVAAAEIEVAAEATHGGDNDDPNSQPDVNNVKQLVASYFELVLNQVQDYVPCSIAGSLVRHFDRKLVTSELMKRLHDPRKADSLVQVPAEVITKRTKHQLIIRELQSAAKTLENLEI